MSCELEASELIGSHRTFLAENGKGKYLLNGAGLGVYLQWYLDNPTSYFVNKSLKDTLDLTWEGYLLGQKVDSPYTAFKTAKDGLKPDKKQLSSYHRYVLKKLIDAGDDVPYQMEKSQEERRTFWELLAEEPIDENPKKTVLELARRFFPDASESYLLRLSLLREKEGRFVSEVLDSPWNDLDETEDFQEATLEGDNSDERTEAPKEKAFGYLKEFYLREKATTAYGNRGENRRGKKFLKLAEEYNQFFEESQTGAKES